ncbi:MAG TPA: transcription antitermination factor NusB [Legionellaceae bacterium]|nr:transcription antitermination factor NusB [Legionellaceae bacterium]
MHLGIDNKEEENVMKADMSGRVYADLSKREKRSLIFHILYAAEAFDYQCSLESIVDNFNRGFGLDIPLDSDVFSDAQAIITNRNNLDEECKPLLSNWRFERLGMCTKLILRYALWELQATDTNPTIVINEAVELAKCFAEKDAYKFVNGILDEALKKFGKNTEESH